MIYCMLLYALHYQLTRPELITVNSLLKILYNFWQFTFTVSMWHVYIACYLMYKNNVIDSYTYRYRLSIYYRTTFHKCDKAAWECPSNNALINFLLTSNVKVHKRQQRTATAIDRRT